MAVLLGLMALTGCSVVDGLRGKDEPAAVTTRGSRSTSASRAAAERRAAEQRKADDELVKTVTRNASPWAWVATLQSGVKSEAGTAVTNRSTGDRVLVGPEQANPVEVKRQPSWILTDRDRADQVVRVRLERRVETWSEPEVFWFEVLGPMPAQLTITTPVRSDGAVTPKLVGSNPPSPIAAVPKSRYPSDDR